MVGIGNVLMSDEGIGVHVVRALCGFAADFPFVEFVEAGSSGMRALHAVAFRRRAYLVDCALMGERPGAMRKFTPADVASRKHSLAFSLHEGDLLDILELSSRLGERPSSVTIFGIEPASLTPGESLSGALMSRLEDYVDIIKSELAGCAI